MSRPLSISINKNVPVNGNEFLLERPTFVDPKTTADMSDAPVSGANAQIKAASTTGEFFGVERPTLDYTWLCFTHAEQKRVQAFFYERRGSVKPFWMPSYVADFKASRAVGPASRDLVFVEEPNFEWVYAPNRFCLAIFDNADRCFVYKISGYTKLGSEGVIQVSGSLDVEIPQESVTMISLIRRVRFATSKLRRQPKTDYVCELKANVIEVIGESLFS